MKILDLRIPDRTGTTIRPVVGPGSPLDEAGFLLWLCRVDSPAPVEFQPPAEVVEQVFFVIDGAGSLQQDVVALPLKRHRAYRFTATAPLRLQQSGDHPLRLLYLASPQPPPADPVDRADLETMEGIHFPACRWGRSITNGASPLKTSGFTTGLSMLAPGGGQVPWHSHPDRQNEVYLVLSGRPQMCVGDSVQELTPPAAVFIPGHQWHQLTNLDREQPLHLIYTYEGSVAAPHWWQERDGVLPPAGRQGNPPLPPGAFPQCTAADGQLWRQQAAAHS